MTDQWNPTGDQYTTYVESRFPIFSNQQQSDYNHSAMLPAKAVNVLRPEDKLVASQFGIPAYVQNCQCGGVMGNRCNKCPDEYKYSYGGLSGGPRKKEETTRCADGSTSCNVEKMTVGGITTITVDDRTLIFLLFIMLIVMICYCKTLTSRLANIEQSLMGSLGVSGGLGFSG